MTRLDELLGEIRALSASIEGEDAQVHTVAALVERDCRKEAAALVERLLLRGLDRIGHLWELRNELRAAGAPGDVIELAERWRRALIERAGDLHAALGGLRPGRVDRKAH